MTTSLDTVQQLATELSEATLPATDPWAKLEAFWQSIEALGPAAPSVTNQLLDDRKQRQAMIEGKDLRHA